MDRYGLAWATVIVLSAFGVVLFSLTGSTSPLRPVVAVWFVGVCPGLAVLRLLRLPRAWELSLAVPLSLAIAAIVAGVVVYSGRWSEPLVLVVLVGLAITAVLADVIASIRALRRPPAHDPSLPLTTANGLGRPNPVDAILSTIPRSTESREEGADPRPPVRR